MKEKRIYKFRRVHRGYDIDEVESYIAAERERCESARLALTERVSALQALCDSRGSELDELKGKEEQIKAAFIAATQNAERLSADVKARYALELDRLKLFRAKWTGAYEELKERYHFDKDALNMEGVAVGIELELGKFLSQDFSLTKGESADEMEEYFKSEVARLTSLQIDKQNETGEDTPAVRELKDKIRDARRSKESAAFSFEEALNPTESLADICRSLGLKSL